MNNKRNYISTYIFILSSFCLVLFLAYNNTEKDIMSISNNKTEQFWVENDTNQPVLITNSLEIESNQINDNVDMEDTNEFNLSENEDDIDYLEKDVKEAIKGNFFINKIIVTESIDDDKTSATFREPINSYKTITTLDKNVVKNINYYPNLYVWTSINTEDIDFINNKPLNLSLNISCNNNEISNLDFDITAKTPRWREWVEIDLSNLETNTYNGVWNVKIINRKDDSVIESRVFKFNKVENNHHLSEI
jgi:hypothetical protein